MGATPARSSKSDSSDWSTSPLAASQFPEEASGANHSRWEFNNRKTLLYVLVGNDFGADPESRLDEIRENQQIINLQGSSDVAAAACDAVVGRRCLGLWRFIGIKSENNAAS